MVQLVCSCLNIRIHSKGATPQLQNASNLKLSANAMSDHFFSSDVGLYHVFLDLGGVTKAQKLLCSSRCVDGWVITTCTGCDLDFYAKCVDDNDNVLVSSVAEMEPSRITTLMESDSYSVLFKMILPEINDNYIQNNIGIELSSGNLDHTVEHVQNQVSNFLKEEQKSMEDQIRQFTEQAHSKFAALQQKIRKHKQSMVYLLIKAKDDKRHCPVEPMAESPLASPISSFRHSSGNDFSSSTDSALIQNELSDQPIETKVQVQVKALRKPISYPTSKLKSGRKQNYAAHSIDIGDVFEMEGFDVNRDTASFYNSDDDTDENSATEDSFIPSKYEVQSHAYATSLPMSVPAFSSFSHYSTVEEEEKIAPIGDHSQIAASMQALAQSVQDGTEMFGDLPRRRLNTGELLRSRPM